MDNLWRDAIDKIGQAESNAYMESQKWFRKLQKMGYYQTYDDAFNTPPDIPEQHEKDRLTKKEFALQRERHDMEKEYGQLRCADCRKWIPFSNTHCPHCHYSNHRDNRRG